MDSRLRSVLVGCSLPVLFLACGSSAPNTQSKAAPVAPPAPLLVAAPTPNLSPVAAPAALVALGRIARPLSLANTFAGWVALPFDPKIVDALEPGLSEALALDAPIEFAVALPPGDVTDVVPSMVISFGLVSTEKSKALLENYNGSALKEHSPGVWVTAEGTKTSCAVAASLGKTTSRLVCGSDSKALTELLPYATRGLPLENLGTADFRTEIRAEALQKRYAAAARMGKTVAVPTLLKLVALGDPRFDRPLSDVAHAVSDEMLDWFQDLERVTIDLVAQSKPDQVTAKVSVNYKSHQSLLATAALSAKGRMSAPSSLFFDLPGTVTRAEYFSPTDPKLLDKPRTLSNALVDGLLAHLEVSAALRSEVKNAMDGVFSQGSASVLGVTPVTLPGGKVQPSDVELLATLVGCYIVGVESPAAPYQAALKTWIKLNNDRAFKKGLDRVLTDKLDEVKKSHVSEGAKPLSRPTPKKPYSELLKLKTKVLNGMPAGSEVATLTFEAKATEEMVRETQKKLHRRSKLNKVDLKSMTFYLAVVPDGARTWLLVTADEKALLDQAKSVVVGSATQRLSQRTDLSAMRGQTATRAGFLSLLDFKDLLGFTLQANGKPAKEAETLYSTLPHHGTTPIFYQFVAAGDEQRPAFESRITFPREVFDDVAASVPALMMSF